MSEQDKVARLMEERLKFLATDAYRANQWYAKHKTHVDGLVASQRPMLCYPPSGSDILHPELWKTPHWIWFLDIKRPTEIIGRHPCKCSKRKKHKEGSKFCNRCGGDLGAEKPNNTILVLSAAGCLACIIMLFWSTSPVMTLTALFFIIFNGWSVIYQASRGPDSDGP